jgi:DNA polymerase-3 subunit alpha
MMNPDDKKDTQENPAIAPGKYVSLHNHTGFSNFDGLGYPDEHFKFCIQNGIDAHAITEHGHMSSYAHAQLWYEGWKKENKDKK